MGEEGREEQGAGVREASNEVEMRCGKKLEVEGQEEARRGLTGLPWLLLAAPWQL